MRKILIDLSDDTFYPRGAFGGFEGEHNATELTLVLPRRLLSAQGEFYMVFDIKKTGQTIFSAPLSVSDGRLVMLLPKQIMRSPQVSVHAAVYRREGEKLLEIAKTTRVALEIKFPERGVEMPLSQDGGTIPGLVLEDAVLPDGENPVKGKAIYRALEELREEWEGKEEEEETEDPLLLASQGRSAKYNFKTPGWKRILNIIRASNGTVDIGLCQGEPDRMVQALAFDFAGFVKYPGDTKASAPILMKRYENVFGNDEALIGDYCKITKVRIAYPKKNVSFPESDGIVSATNPVNCYLDVYVEAAGEREFIATFDWSAGEFKNGAGLYTVKSVKEEVMDGYPCVEVLFTDGSRFSIDYSMSPQDIPSPMLSAGDVLEIVYSDGYYENAYRLHISEGTKAFNMNYAGFADSHNCQAITEETDAAPTGIYGETLDFYTVDVASMPYYLTDKNVHVAAESSSAWGAYGVTIASDGRLRTAFASNDDIDKGWNKYKIICPANLKYAVDKILRNYGLI